MQDLEHALRTVVERCLCVSAGETVLVVADPSNAVLGDALLQAAQTAGGDAILTILPPNPARGTEPSAPVAAAFAACDVFIAPCLPSLSHTSARKRACEGGARGAAIPDDGDLSARGAFGNVPCGEGFVSVEDEKILGTAHIAFGASAGIGGTVTVPVHEDVVVLEPSLWIGCTQVLDAGRSLL